jgi:hypothetical protein
MQKKETTFADEMLNLENKLNAKEEALEQVEAEAKEESKKAEKSESEYLLELISKEGGPTMDQIEQWKEKFRDKVYAVYFDKKDFYIFRYLTRVEWKEISAQISQMKTPNETIIDELIVQKALLYPTYDTELRALAGAGTFETLSKQIRYASNFVPDELALRMIVKI